MALAALLVDCAGRHEIDLENARVDARLRSGEFFWLDMYGPDEGEVRAVADEFGFHPLSVEDSTHFGQRAKLEEYGDHVFLVVFGSAPDTDGLVEVHCYYSERFLVTIHRDEAPALAGAAPLVSRALTEDVEPVRTLHAVVAALVESFSSPVDSFSERLDAIEDDLVDRPSERHVQDILRMRQRVAVLRKAIAPERDLFGRLAAGEFDLPGMTPDARHYFRDLYDQLFRLGELLDTARELMTGALDVYLSASSNRLGEVTKQLTLVATIFLPLTFLTGFFGQNFGWMVGHIDSWTTFLAFGVGLQVGGIAAIVGLFKYRRWF